MPQTKNEVEIDVLIEDLKPGERTVKELKYGGFLFLEHDIPFLIVYRNIPNDAGTIRLARSGASYLVIGEDHFDYFRAVVRQLTKKMSDYFGTFIMIEIYSGAGESTDFIIRGPSHKLSVSLDVLREELENIDAPNAAEHSISARIEKTKERLNPGCKEFFTIEELKGYGCTFLGLQVPPIYRKNSGEVYPLYFKQFRNQFVSAVHKAVLEFIRVQTTSDLRSYAALGKRKIHDGLFKIDKALTKIENAYQFLLLIAPVNMQSIRKTFLGSNFKDLEPFHYRLMPIDPDLLKRRLYNLRIDEVDDPELAFLFEEKREEIDQQLTMLKERGTKSFFFGSLRLYKGIEKNLLHEAKLVLDNIPEDTSTENMTKLNAEEFAELAKKEFGYLHQQASGFRSRVHIRNDVNIIMVSKGELYLPSDYTMTKKEAAGIIQHEIGTHALTYYNGRQQPLTQLSQGLAGYDSLQEGMAVLSEYLVGSLSKNRLRLMAGRVVAGEAVINDADFKEVFHLLHSTYGFSQEAAFNISSRVFQGSGFIKDIVYLRGLVELRDYLQSGGNLDCLLAGKFAMAHLPLIKDLTDRKILQPAKLKPRYFEAHGFQKRLNKLRNGIALSKMV